jgi:hypothetical protein
MSITFKDGAKDSQKMARKIYERWRERNGHDMHQAACNYNYSRIPDANFAREQIVNITSITDRKSSRVKQREEGAGIHRLIETAGNTWKCVPMVAVMLLSASTELRSKSCECNQDLLRLFTSCFERK